MVLLMVQQQLLQLNIKIFLINMIFLWLNKKFSTLSDNVSIDKTINTQYKVLQENEVSETSITLSYLSI